MKNIIVFGGTGQVGSELLRILSRNYKIFSPDSNFLDISDNNKVEEYLRIIKPYIIFNCVAYHDLKKCELYNKNAININILSHIPLASYCQLNKISYVTFSTNYVFDGNAIYPFVEDSEKNPCQFYGISRSIGEEVVKNYCPDFHYIIRTSAIYGSAYSKSKGGNFISKILDNAKINNKIEVDCKMQFNSTFAEDLACYIVNLIKIAPNGIYNIVNTGNCTWFDLAKFAIDTIGIKCQIVPVKRQLDCDGFIRPQNTTLDISKINSFGIDINNWKYSLKSYVINL